MKFLGKAATLVTATAVAVSMGAAPALASTADRPSFDPPTSQSDTEQNNERLLTAIGAHGSAVVGEYVGLSEQINQSYATPGNGVSVDNYATNPYFGIYGTTANENPDPYTANLFYKWYLTANGMTEQANAVTDYMYNYLFDGYSGSCITSDNKSQKNGTSIALSGRPDVIVTKASLSDDSVLDSSKANWTEQIKTINNFKSSGSKYYIAPTDHYVGDENYDPQFAGYIEVTTPGFVQSVYNAADAAQAAYDYSWNNSKQQAKVALRYGYDDAQATAQAYEKYTKGSDLYVLSKIADKTVSRKTVAYVTSVSGSGKDAVFTIQGNLDQLTSGESNGHILQPLDATCDNLANKLDPTLAKEAKPGQTTTCTVDQLATADVIILTKADNMAYNNLGADTYSLGSETLKSDFRGSLPSLEDAEKDADGNTIQNGETASRHYGDIALGYFKNNFYGPTETNTTLVSNIQDALKDAGYTKKANQAILSCLMENASNCDGGSVDSMALHGIINGFAYPEIMNPLEQFGYYLNTMSHIKTKQVSTMVQKLAQDMTLPDGIEMSSIESYDTATALKIEMQEDQGFVYYAAHKADIDASYKQLTPSNRFNVPTSADVSGLQKQINALSTTSLKSQTIKVSTKKLTIKAGKSKKISASAKTALTFKKTSGNKKITVGSKGKVAVKKSLAKGSYKIKVKVTAKQTAKYKKATKTATITVKVTK